MNVQRFFAPTAREALRRVKEALGADAIVLGNRALDGGVEILALPAEAATLIAPKQEEQAPAPVAQSPARRGNPPAAREEEYHQDYTVSLSSAGARGAATKAHPWQAFAAPAVEEAPPVPARRPPFAERVAQADARSALKERSQPRQEPVRPAKDVFPTDERPVARAEALPPLEQPAPREEPAPQPAPREEVQMSPQLMDELQAIRGMIEKQLAGFAWGEMGRQAPSRTLLLGEMLDVGFSAALARRLMDMLPANCEVPEGRTLMRNALARELLTLDTEGDLVDAGGVFALVGPTGVGKTTTTAKLAARCVVRHGAESLALLTTDGYRIGAHEQLRIYGRILGVPVHVVRDAADLRRTLSDLRNRHMVLIDTAGVGQRDRMVAEQLALLSSAKAVRRLLLLNATSRGDTLDDVIRAYAGPDLAGCVVTKVDEAAALAPVLDSMIRHKLKCAYIANGQRVPEDLHLANRAWLLHRALRRSTEDSPHTLRGDEAGLLMATATSAGGLGANRV